MMVKNGENAVEFRIVGKERYREISGLYRISDRDFVLPFSERKIGAEDMMEDVFRTGEYICGFYGERVVVCGGYEIKGEMRAEIHGITVHPDFRGRGWGREVCHRLMDRLREKGIKMVEVGTWEGSIGLNLFLSLGFGVVKRYPDQDRRPRGIRTVKLVLRLQY